MFIYMHFFLPILRRKKRAPFYICSFKVSSLNEECSSWFLAGRFRTLLLRQSEKGFLPQRRSQRLAITASLSENFATTMECYGNHNHLLQFYFFSLQEIITFLKWRACFLGGEDTSYTVEVKVGVCM